MDSKPKPTTAMPELMTAGDIEAVYQISRRTVDRYVAAGRLRRVKLGTLSRFYRSEVAGLIQLQASPALMTGPASPRRVG